MKQPQSPVSTLYRELRRSFFRRNHTLLMVSVVCVSLLSLFNLLVSYLMQQIVDVIATLDTGRLIWIFWVSAGSFALMMVVYGIQRITCSRFLQRAIRQYRSEAFDRMMEKSVPFIAREGTASYISMLTNDVTAIETDYLSKIFNLIMEVLGFVGAIALMLWYSPLLTGAALLLSLLPVGASLLCSGKLEAVEKQVSDDNSAFVRMVQETFAGFSVIRSFRAEKQVIHSFRQSNDQLEDAKYLRRTTQQLVYMLSAGTGFIAQMGTFLLAAWMAVSGKNVTPGTVLVFLQLVNFIISPISSVPPILASRRAAHGLMDKLAQALRPEEQSGGTIPMEPLSREIALSEVSFGYEENAPILKELTFTFEAGKSYAIVGPSGSGKSTLLQLLMGYQPGYQGSIRMDGRELTQLEPDSLCQQISLIQQEVFIFNSSIRSNITMFSSCEEEKLLAAVRAAGLSALVEERGLDFVCGENGVNLSGGERQRISIARSLLRHASLLLADEATAALDNATACSVLTAILGLPATRIVVTHNLNEEVLGQFDTIVVMAGGKIREAGSFDELMARREYFYALHTLSATS